MKTLQAVENRMFDNRLSWSDIDRGKALENTRVLDLLREACLIESYFAVYTGRMLELFAYDVNATSIFTIEAFEAYTHFYTLRRYLDTVDYRPVTDEEIVALRSKDAGRPHDDEIRELVNFGMTELFAARFFADVAEMTSEPVLRNALTRFAAEEITHSEFAFDLLEARLRADAAVESRIVEAAREFRHVGAYVLPGVSPARPDNLVTIRAVNERLGKLLGRPLSDYLAQ